MTPRYLRSRATRRDNAMAALISSLVALGMAAGMFYFARLLLAREPLEHSMKEEVKGALKAEK